MRRRSNSRAVKGRGARTKRPAVTSEILPPKQAWPRVPAKWREHFDRLNALREALLRSGQSLAEGAREESPSFSTHMADAGTDTYDQDLALSMLSSEQDAVYEIEQALERIREGTYGICQLSGKKIDERRLEAVPWARFTMEAERDLERQGQVRKARLGQRDTVARASANSYAEEEE